MKLPPCGLYRTRAALGEIAAGRLVFFHDHGEPGPGLYLPERWRLNRAVWQKQGTTLPAPEWAAANLEALPAEGFYRVAEAFDCCAKGCRTFQKELLVQLGYDATARALLFVPEWTEAGLAIPETGSALDDGRVGKLVPLVVALGQGVERGEPQ